MWVCLCRLQHNLFPRVRDVCPDLDSTNACDLQLIQWEVSIWICSISNYCLILRMTRLSFWSVLCEIPKGNFQATELSLLNYCSYYPSYHFTVTRSYLSYQQGGSCKTSLNQSLGEHQKQLQMLSLQWWILLVIHFSSSPTILRHWII